MKNIYKIIWSDEALSNFQDTIDYLESKWSEREIRKFAQLLEKHLEFIKDNPFLFAESGRSKGLRKSVLSRQISIYYRIIDHEIHIISLFDNRQDPNKLSNTFGD